MKFMKLALAILAVLFLVPHSHAQVGAFTNYCSQGASQATTSGLKSTNYQLGAIPSCAVTVYLTGTTTKATIYSNSSSTPLTNPFTATTAGQWLFYASITSCYDVTMSGGFPPNSFISPVTLTGLCGVGSSAGAGITALTGDGTATGPGSVLFTLATVNGSPGACGDSTHVGRVTVNGKGLTTACSATAILGYTIGANTYAPGANIQSLTFSPAAGFPVLMMAGASVGGGLSSAYIDLQANLFQWGAMNLHVDNNFPNKLFSIGVENSDPYELVSSGYSVALGLCSDITGPSCTDFYSFTQFSTLTSYGVIGPSGSSFANPWSFTAAGVASTPPLSLTGAWFTGGSSTTTKPQFLIEPAGTTSTGWSTNGTGIGINGTASNANPLDIQLNGVSKFSVNGIGVVTQTGVAGINSWNAGMLFNAGENFAPTGTANSGANFGSNLYQMTGSYWTGSAAANDTWQVNPILGTGANPISIFTIAHAGSTGPAAVSIPALKFSTTTTVSGLASCSATTKGMATAVTDASSPTYLGTVTGGSTTYAPVICNGTNWVTY